MLKVAVILLIALIVALGAGRFALASIVKNSNPALAARVTGDPGAPLRAMLRKTVDEPAALARLDVGTVARRALGYVALDPVPLRALALKAATDGRAGDVVRFATLSEKVSRRDFPTQLILIEAAVDAGNFTTALRHYDIALTTRDQARGVLFPVLSVAIGEPQIRQATVLYVRRRANWVREFVDFTMRDGPEGPRRITQLLLIAGAPQQKELMKATAPTLLGMLADQREFSLARTLHARLSNGSTALLRTPGFLEATVDPSAGPFAWRALGDADSGAVFEGKGANGKRMARVFAGAGERRTVLQRLLMLPPGAYRLNERRRLIQGGDDARATWTLRCASDPGNPLIWSGPSDRTVYSVVDATGPVIKANCPVQRLDLDMVGGNNPAGLELVIESFGLQR